MESIFNVQTANWFNIGVFGNLIQHDLKKGTNVPILNSQDLLYRCNMNCNIVTTDDVMKKKCYDYCKRFVNNLVQSNTFAKNKCPFGDAKCCKKECQDNDFAYYLCRNQNSYSESKPLHVIFYILMILFVILIMIKLNRIFNKE